MIEGDLRQLLVKAGEACGLSLSPTDIVLEHPADLSHGDMATNVALALSKRAGKNPRELAEELVSEVAKNKPAFLEKIEIAGPGFINFTLSVTFLREMTGTILSQKDTWGNQTVHAGKLFLIEYTSPNLFKPLHIGNLVGNILGESIALVTAALGASVKRLNYPSDIGLTVAKSVWGLKKTGGNPDDIGALGEAYRIGNSAYEEDALAKPEIEAINRALYENSDPELASLRERGIETSRKHLAALCLKLGTQFDNEFFESQSAPLGKRIVEAHIEDGVFEKSEGAIVYKGESEGLHTRVFLNSQSFPTYEAKEVGLFDLKSQAYPDFDTSITVTGIEQKDFFSVVFASLRKIFPERVAGKELLHVANGFLSLTTGKMSSRKGNVITGESLIEDMRAKALEKMVGRNLPDEASVADAVAVAAIKFTVLRQGSGKNIVFDPEKSLSLEGDSGPYIQYTHTRALSVLEKAQAEHVTSDAHASAQAVTEVERLLYRFPEVITRAGLEYEPHYIANYLTELSAAFNSWYAKVKILDGTEAAPYKLALTEAIAVTLKRGLWLLGITAPERM